MNIVIHERQPDGRILFISTDAMAQLARYILEYPDCSDEQARAAIGMADDDNAWDLLLSAMEWVFSPYMED